jgi:hypothetical protein
MKIYNTEDLVQAFGLSNSLAKELQFSTELMYIVNNGDIYVFACDADNKTIPLFRADCAKQIPSLYHDVVMGIRISDYHDFTTADLFGLPKEERTYKEG